MQYPEDDEGRANYIYGEAARVIDSRPGSPWEPALYILAQGLKGISSYASCSWDEVFPEIDEFFQNETYCSNYDTDQCENRFKDLWPNIRNPFRFLSRQNIPAEMKEAAEDPCPEAVALAAAKYPRQPLMPALLGVCFFLDSTTSPGEPFFLSCRKAAEIIGTDPKNPNPTAYLLRKLVQDGILTITQKATTTQAPRYLLSVDTK